MDPTPGLTFRQYRGIEDIPAMLAVHEACRERDQVDYYSVAYRVPNMDAEEYASDVALSLADGSDRNVLIAEVDKTMIAHCRLEWWREWDHQADAEKWAYLIRAWVAPRWRRKGIGKFLLIWANSEHKNWTKIAPLPESWLATRLTANTTRSSC